MDNPGLTREERLRPSEVAGPLPRFDRFADKASRLTGRAPFFALCVAMIVLWVPTLFVLDLNTSQLVVQTVTAIVTFLLVALLQNGQARADAATQHKLNEISDALANLISAMDVDNPHLREDVNELKAAVGLEERETV